MPLALFARGTRPPTNTSTLEPAIGTTARLRSGFLAPLIQTV
jgi:hypothetical protein